MQGRRYVQMESEERRDRKMIIGNKEFDLTNRTYVMGILNVTPDSFSDGG